MRTLVVSFLLSLLVAGCTATPRDPNAPRPQRPSPSACERSLEDGAVASTANAAACEGLWCFRNSLIDAKCFASETRCHDNLRNSQRQGFGATGCMQMLFR